MRRLLLILGIAAALALVACGGDDDDESGGAGAQNGATTQTATTGATGKRGATSGSRGRKAAGGTTGKRKAESPKAAKRRAQRRTLRTILRGRYKAPPEPGENLRSKKARDSFRYSQALVICSGAGVKKLARDLKVERNREAVAEKFAEKSGLKNKDVARRGCLAGLKISKKP